MDALAETPEPARRSPPEVASDRIPELLGEIERLRSTVAAPWCSIRSCSSVARWLSWFRSS